MIRRLAPLLMMVVGGVFGLADAEAAIFRIQGATYSDKGTFVNSGNSDNYEISGDFRINTDYKDVTGVVQNGDYSLTAWNITFRNATTNASLSFVSNMQGLTTNSTGFASRSTGAGAIDNNRISICSDSSSPCSSPDFVLTFSNPFNTVLSDSLGSALSRSTSLSAVAIPSGTGNSISAQADFVPFTPALVGIAPILLLRKKIGKSVFANFA